MNTATRNSVERDLSSFWRYDRSDDRAKELVSILQGADVLIGNMGSDVSVTWADGDASYTNLRRRIVALDYGPLRQEKCPFPGDAVDEVIGYAAHEGGHCLWTAPDKEKTIKQGVQDSWTQLPPTLQNDWQSNEQATLAELCRVQNVLEDAYVDRRVSSQWPVLGEYIRIARDRIRERTAIDLEAISQSERPDRNGAINLWVSLSLYGHPMPAKVSDHVQQAIGALLTLSRRASQEEVAEARQVMALDAAIILWREFPHGGATPSDMARTSLTNVPVLATPDLGATGQTTAQQHNVPEAATPRNLDDFDPSTPEGQGGRQVSQVPPALLSEVQKRLSRGEEDLSQPVARALAERPWKVGAITRSADYDPTLAKSVVSRVQRETLHIRQVFQSHRDMNSIWRHGQERGRLDERRLWKPLVGDPTFYKRKEARGKPSLAIGLLLDVSGSMKAHMSIVEEAAAAFSQGLVGAQGIDFAAWCYTGEAGRVALTRICDRHAPRLCLANIEKHGGTPSGAAIAAVKVLMERLRGRNKVLIHFTDGHPDSAAHVVKAVAACREAGVRVYAIGLPKYREMFSVQYGSGNYQVVETVLELPRAVAGIVRVLGAATRLANFRRQARLMA